MKNELTKMIETIEKRRKITRAEDNTSSSEKKIDERHDSTTLAKQHQSSPYSNNFDIQDHCPDPLSPTSLPAAYPRSARCRQHQKKFPQISLLYAHSPTSHSNLLHQTQNPLDRLYGSYISPLYLTSFFHLISFFPTRQGSATSHRYLDNPKHPTIVELTIANPRSWISYTRRPVQT